MRKVLFLGDSITDRGEYVSLVDAYFRLNPCFGTLRVENIGLCSENTSGQTEPGHPGARPNIHTRIDRILSYYKADVAIVMYGINDGIYKPFSEERFTAFKNGMTALITKLKAANLQIYLCTPTAFDKKSCSCKLCEVKEDGSCDGMYAGYNEVMTKYAGWISANFAADVDKIIDINTAMNRYFDARHSLSETYRSGDGIHPNDETSAVMATTILKEGFGANCDLLIERNNAQFKRMFALVFHRNQLIHKYVKETLGHTSPFHDKYLSEKKLEQKVQVLDRKILKASGATLRAYQFRFARKYKREKFVFQNIEGVIIFPRKADNARNWLWRAEFFGAFTDADELALKRGSHLVFFNLPDNYGCPNAIDTLKEFFDFVTDKYFLSSKVTFLGLSRGALTAVNFACRFPADIKGLLLDAPVVDIRSWPKGNATGAGSPEDWEKLKLVYQDGFPDPAAYGAELAAKLRSLAEHRIPVAVIANEWDEVVPFVENGILIRKAYEERAELYFEAVKPLRGHHPHGGACTADAIDFLEAQARKLAK